MAAATSRGFVSVWDLRFQLKCRSFQGTGEVKIWLPKLFIFKCKAYEYQNWGAFEVFHYSKLFQNSLLNEPWNYEI